VDTPAELPDSITGSDCVVQPYLNDARGVDPPTLVIERHWPEQGLFAVYEGEFGAL